MYQKNTSIKSFYKGRVGVPPTYFFNMGVIQGADNFFNLGPGLQHIHVFAVKVSLFLVFGALDMVLLS